MFGKKDNYQSMLITFRGWNDPERESSLEGNVGFLCEELNADRMPPSRPPGILFMDGYAEGNGPVMKPGEKIELRMDPTRISAAEVRKYLAAAGLDTDDDLAPKVYGPNDKLAMLFCNCLFLPIAIPLFFIIGIFSSRRKKKEDAVR